MSNPPRIIKGLFDLSYQIDPDSALDNHIIQQGIFGDWLARHLVDLIPADGTILDIGANAGLLTLPFAKIMVPQGMIYAYEPDPEVLEQLETNVNLNQLANVRIFPLALQDDTHVAEVILNIRRVTDGDNLINKGLSSIHPFPVYNVNSQTVAASTIDVEVVKHSLARIDFIKIDVEGAEYRVLQGGQTSLMKSRPIIQYEYSTLIDELINFPNSRFAYEFLTQLGYQQYGLREERYLSLLTSPPDQTAGINILCFPNS
jgi:FkbM family methyltransferase